MLDQLINLSNTVQVTAASVLAQVPDGAPAAPGGLGVKGNSIVGAGKWVGLMVCVLAMIGAGIKLATDHRHGDGGQSASGIVKVLLAVAVVSGASSLVSFMV